MTPNNSMGIIIMYLVNLKGAIICMVKILRLICALNKTKPKVDNNPQKVTRAVSSNGVQFLKTRIQHTTDAPPSKYV